MRVNGRLMRRVPLGRDGRHRADRNDLSFLHHFREGFLNNGGGRYGGSAQQNDGEHTSAQCR